MRDFNILAENLKCNFSFYITDIKNFRDRKSEFLCRTCRVHCTCSIINVTSNRPTSSNNRNSWFVFIKWYFFTFFNNILMLFCKSNLRIFINCKANIISIVKFYAYYVIITELVVRHQNSFFFYSFCFYNYFISNFCTDFL